MMLDDNVVAVSPSSTYRVLKTTDLFNLWNTTPKNAKKKGFDQPTRPHEHWHIDIKYVNFHCTFLFLTSIIDGFSRYIVHYELRLSMQEFDVQVTLQRALEKFPWVSPRIISDNGTQFIAKEFGEFLRLRDLQHARTSICYPQSNGKIERFHRSLSEECLRTSSFVGLNDARQQIAAYIEHYNTERLHSSLYYLTLEDFLFNRIGSRLKERDEKLYQARDNRIRQHSNNGVPSYVLHLNS
jgi:transposase InsO family protein